MVTVDGSEAALCNWVLQMAAEIEDPFGDDLNDLPTENFQIGLERDGQFYCATHIIYFESCCIAHFTIRCHAAALGPHLRVEEIYHCSLVDLYIYCLTHTI